MTRSIRVVMVSPRYKGNLGFVVRAMANFGLADLWLVGPRADRDSREARERAVHAVRLLESATVVDTLEEALAGVDLAVGTTARSNPGTARKRAAITPAELLGLLPDAGTIGLVLGPEETGLTDGQIDRMDLLTTIPCSGDYPVMNVSHAASLLFYELTRPVLDRPFQPGQPSTKRLMLEALERMARSASLKDPEGVRRALKAWVFRSLLSEAEARAILAFMRAVEP